MTRRRIAVSLVAAAATSLALVSPAHAAPSLSSTSSALSSSASAEEETDGDDAVEGPLGSLVLDDEAEMVFAVLEAAMAAGNLSTTAVATYVEMVPGGGQQVRDFLGQFGIRV